MFQRCLRGIARGPPFHKPPPLVRRRSEAPGLTLKAPARPPSWPCAEMNAVWPCPIRWPPPSLGHRRIGFARGCPPDAPPAPVPMTRGQCLGPRGPTDPRLGHTGTHKGRACVVDWAHVSRSILETRGTCDGGLTARVTSCGCGGKCSGLGIGCGTPMTGGGVLAASLVHCLGRPLGAVSDVAWELRGGGAVHCPSACLVLLPPPPPPTSTICVAPAPLHCHDGAAYIVVRVVDSLYISFPEALPAPPLYSALTLMGMDEWPNTAPPVPPPPDGVDDVASDSGASSHSDASSHNDDPLN